jgi:hypothetical protein
MYGKKDHGNEKYHKQARNDIPPMRREGFGDQTRCEHQEYPGCEANKPCRGMRCTLHRALPGLDGCQTQTVYALRRTLSASRTREFSNPLKTAIPSERAPSANKNSRPRGLPAEVYRVNAKTGIRKLLYRPSPADPTGVETVGPVLVTADGKSYVYAYTRTLSTLYILHAPDTK